MGPAFIQRAIKVQIGCSSSVLIHLLPGTSKSVVHVHLLHVTSSERTQ